MEALVLQEAANLVDAMSDFVDHLSFTTCAESNGVDGQEFA